MARCRYRDAGGVLDLEQREVAVAAKGDDHFTQERVFCGSLSTIKRKQAYKFKRLANG